MTGVSSQWLRRSESADETTVLGRALGVSLVSGAVIALVGPLGAGKTRFVKGVALGNGPGDQDDATSPTFTLVNEYVGRLRLCHVDTYRLEGSNDFMALGIDEMISTGSAVVVEWADRVRSVLPDDVLWIEITPLAENSRRFDASAMGETSLGVLKAWRGVVG